MPVKRSVPEASDYMEDTDVRSKKRRYDEDEDDERPTRKTSRAAADEDEDDDEEEERPVRRTTRRKAVEDDEEDERPARKVTRRKADDDDDDDDEDERPVRKTRRAAPVDDDEEDEDPDELPGRSSVIQKGWAAARQAAAASSDFTDEFKLSEEPQIIKFLDNEPSIYRQHWLKNKPGKKSYVCPGKRCPICNDLGDNPGSKFAWPVVNLSVEGMPTQLLVAGVRLATQLDKRNNEKVGPLERQFWALSKTGDGRSTQPLVQVVKARDLAEDWDIDPDEVEEALAKAEPLDMDKVIRQSTMAELRAVVDELD